jgi:hypothetical protein
LFAEQMTNIYANDERNQMDWSEDSFDPNDFLPHGESNQMDCSNDIHDPNDFLPCTNALLTLSQQLSSGDPGYDSEEDYANYMASLDISDESQVSVSSIDTHRLYIKTSHPVETSASKQEG